MLENDPNISPPSVLYKYRDWNNPYHRNILQNKEIYFPKPSEFNDPFDGNIPIRWDKLSYEDCLNKNIELIKISNRNLDAKSLKSHAIRITEAKSLWHPDMLQKETKEEIMKWDALIGLFSLSEVPNTILMWSHYSSNHTGFVVGLDTKLPQDNYDFDYLKPIKYQIEYPMISGNDNNSDRFEKKFFCKSELWNYEQEWRISKNHIKNRIIKLLPETISCVIIGCYTPEKNVRKIQQIIYKYIGDHVSIFKAEMKIDEFGLLISELV